MEIIIDWDIIKKESNNGKKNLIYENSFLK